MVFRFILRGPKQKLNFYFHFDLSKSWKVLLNAEISMFIMTFSINDSKPNISYLVLYCNTMISQGMAREVKNKRWVRIPDALELPATAVLLTHVNKAFYALYCSFAQFVAIFVMIFPEVVEGRVVVSDFYFTTWILIKLLQYIKWHDAVRCGS